MQILQCLIYNSTLETSIWSKKRGRYRRFSDSNSVYVREKVLINKKWTSHTWRDTSTVNNQFIETKTLISNLYLIRQSFLGYRCKSGIAIFPCRLSRESLEITLTVPLRFTAQNIKILPNTPVSFTCHNSFAAQWYSCPGLQKSSW